MQFSARLGEQLHEDYRNSIAFANDGVNNGTLLLSAELSEELLSLTVTVSVKRLNDSSNAASEECKCIFVFFQTFYALGTLLMLVRPAQEVVVPLETRLNFIEHPATLVLPDGTTFVYKFLIEPMAEVAQGDVKFKLLSGKQYLTIDESTGEFSL